MPPHEAPFLARVLIKPTFPGPKNLRAYSSTYPGGRLLLMVGSACLLIVVLTRLAEAFHVSQATSALDDRLRPAAVGCDMKGRARNIPSIRSNMEGKTLNESIVAVLAFVSMMGAALVGRFRKTRPSSEHQQDDTSSVVRLVGNLFVVMTSLVLGLMLNSAKNTFETNSQDIRALATEIILLDRTMRALGPEAGDARRHLVEYV